MSKRQPRINGSAVQLRPLWTEIQTAAFLNCEPAALRAARCSGTGAFARLPWIKIGTARCAPIRYRPEVVEAFVEESERCHADLEGGEVT